MAWNSLNLTKQYYSHNNKPTISQDTVLDTFDTFLIAKLLGGWTFPESNCEMLRCDRESIIPGTEGFPATLFIVRPPGLLQVGTVDSQREMTSASDHVFRLSTSSVTAGQVPCCRQHNRKLIDSEAAAALTG